MVPYGANSFRSRSSSMPSSKFFTYRFTPWWQRREMQRQVNSVLFFPGRQRLKTSCCSPRINERPDENNGGTYIIMIIRHLVALDAILFDLVKLALQLSLALQTLLSAPDVQELPAEVLAVHFIHRLEGKKRQDRDPESLSGALVGIRPETHESHRDATSFPLSPLSQNASGLQKSSLRNLKTKKPA